MGVGFVREYLRWIARWRTVPVVPWVRAARCFYAQDFAGALRLYISGLERYGVNHPVAPYALYDALSCCDSLGQYAQASELAARLLSSRLGILPNVRAKISRIFVLNDELQEAGSLCDDSSSSAQSDREAQSVTSTRGAASRSKQETHNIWAQLALLLLRQDASASVIICVSEHESLRPRGILSQLAGPVSELSTAYLRDLEARAISGEWGAEHSLALLLALGHARLVRREGVAARRTLGHALKFAPNSSCLLGLLAQSYLLSGDGYNPRYARQLATEACRLARWRNGDLQALLAECYYHEGNRLAAYAMAHKPASEATTDDRMSALREQLTEEIEQPIDRVTGRGSPLNPRFLARAH